MKRETGPLRALEPARAREHLCAAMAWLARAQREAGGISAAFSWLRGWWPPYPETTGYIINTLLAYGRLSGEPEWAQRARRAGEWLLGVQLASGAFPGGVASATAKPRVFNTGMILLGLAELARETGDGRFAAAGERALGWLARTQDPDGSWTTIAPEGVPHAYHSRVAWGMLEMAAALGRAAQFEPHATRACAWVVDQQDADGWFRHNDLIPGLPPLTHNLAYVVRGLLECGLALKRSEWVRAAERASEALRRDWEQSGFLAAGYGPGWKRGPAFRCVTGEAQLGLVWWRLAGATGEPRWRDAARRIACQVATTQSLGHWLPGVRGAIPGASPRWQRYVRFGYPNWATKFYADLLMALLSAPA